MKLHLYIKRDIGDFSYCKNDLNLAGSVVECVCERGWRRPSGMSRQPSTERF